LPDSLFHVSVFLRQKPVISASRPLFFPAKYARLTGADSCRRHRSNRRRTLFDIKVVPTTANASNPHSRQANQGWCAKGKIRKTSRQSSISGCSSMNCGKFTHHAPKLA
jgi:hypothetical protein